MDPGAISLLDRIVSHSNVLYAVEKKNKNEILKRKKMRLKSLLCLATGSGAISWNFFSSSAPDIEHGQDFSNFFHEVVEEHQEELHEIEVRTTQTSCGSWAFSQRKTREK